MDNETKLPMDWVPLREAAERLARETHDAYAAVHKGYAAWDDLPDYESGLDDESDWESARVIGSPRRIYTDAHALLLADLGRPNSRLTWVFWLQQQQVEPPPGWTWWEIVSDADSASALRAALLAVVPHV